ncbi:hypothetical protein EDD16DRAFT_1704319 [Pisolithus croceorrhizus]|nr:hypothetical protein EDD16DRAFT_1704319 [Pisolithus croceorrhizus]
MAGVGEQETIASLAEEFQQFAQTSDPFKDKMVGNVKELVTWYKTLMGHQGLIFPSYTIPRNTEDQPSEGRTLDGGKELGLGKPPPFDGTSGKYKSWITSVNNCLNLNCHIYNTKERKIGFTLSFMSQGLSIHFTKNYLKECTTLSGDIYILDSWMTFLLKMEQIFKVSDMEALAFLKMAEIEQGKKPLSKYIGKFLDLITRANISCNNQQAGINAQAQSLALQEVKSKYTVAEFKELKKALSPEKKEDF